MFSCPLINTELCHLTIIQCDNKEGGRSGGGEEERTKEGRETEEIKEDLKNDHVHICLSLATFKFISLLIYPPRRAEH